MMGKRDGKKLLNCISKYVIVEAQRESQRHGPPPIIDALSPYRAAVTSVSSGGLFFPSEDLMTKTYQGYNEYTNLNQVRICNHWHALLSFVPIGHDIRRVSPSEKLEGRPPICALVSHVSDYNRFQGE